MYRTRLRLGLLEILPLSLVLLVAAGGGCSGADGGSLTSPAPDASTSSGGGSSGSSGSSSSGGASGSSGGLGDDGGGGSSSGGSSDDASPVGDDSGPVSDGSTSDDGSTGMDATVCAPVLCKIMCPYGFAKNKVGCDICACASEPDGGDDAGPSCKDNGDCDGSDVCAYAKADACAAKGTCVKSSPSTCNAIEPGCACDGSTINTICNGLPDGYVTKPLRHTGSCN
jgi:hypothetical protein